MEDWDKGGIDNPALPAQYLDLLNRLLDVQTFRSAPNHKRILICLANHYPHSVNTETLRNDVWRQPESNGNPSLSVSTSTVPVAVHRLRKALNEYFQHGLGRSESLKCWIPDCVRDEGSLLAFADQDTLPGLTGMLWQPHVCRRPILIVTNETLCFRDNKTNVSIRFFNFNPPVVDNAGALHALETMSKTPYEHMFAPGFLSRNNLRASYLYTPSGEIEALHLLSSWFSNSAGIRTTRIVSYEHCEMKQYSPILLGSIRTNHYIQEFYDNHPQFRYQISPEVYGEIVVRLPKESERRLLKEYHPHGSKQKLTVNSKPGECVFVIVTRFASDSGAWTLISSDYTRAIQSVAETLTSEPAFGRLLAAIEWKAVPASFQMLLNVNLKTLDRKAEDAHIIMATGE
jgi:hypothetical protein